MAARILTKRSLRRGSEAWLKARRRHGGVFRIGSSDAPVIVLGSHHGRAPLDLWLEKMTGQPDHFDQAAQYDLRQGRALEDVCAHEAALALGAVRARRGPGARVRRRGGIWVHPEHEFMTANLDRVISGLASFDGNPLSGPGVLECKAPRYAGMLRVKQGGPRPGVIIQVLHQLAVTGWQWALCAHYHRDFGVLLFLVERRGYEKLIAEIIRREQAFYECLQNGQMPPGDLQAPVPPHIPPQFQQATAWRSDPIWRAALKRLQQAKESREQSQSLYDAARQDVEFLMGAMQEVNTPWGAVSWKHSKPSSRLDAKLLRARLVARALEIASVLEHPSNVIGAEGVAGPDHARLVYDRSRVAAALDRVRTLPGLIARAQKPAAPSRPFITKFGAA
jgi:predicted phage-related endonuclease